LCWGVLKSKSYDALKKSVPGFVRDEPVLDETYKRQGDELDRIRAAVFFIRNMVISVSTCPDDGLVFWEKLFNMSNPELSPQSRRELLKMRCRGAGTLTTELIRILVESFENGEARVTDHPRDSTVEIRFISTIGTPPNIDAIREALDDYLHAYYDVMFTLRYLLVKEVEQKTISQLESTLIDSFAF